MSDFPFLFFGHRPRESSDRERRLYFVRFEDALSEETRGALGAEAGAGFFGAPVSSHALYVTDEAWAAWAVDVDRTWAPDARRGWFPDNDSLAIDALTEVLLRWHGTASIREVVFAGALSDEGSTWDDWTRARQDRPSELAGVVDGSSDLRREGDAWMNADDAYDARIRNLASVPGRRDEGYAAAAREAFAARLGQVEGIAPAAEPDGPVPFERGWAVGGAGRSERG